MHNIKRLSFLFKSLCSSCPSWFILLCVLCVSAVNSFAAEPRPLPDFTVLAKDDTEVHSVAMCTQPQWVLVYVRPECASCKHMLSFLDGQPAADLTRVIVIVDGQRDSATEMMARYSHLASLPWFLDRDGNARTALGTERKQFTFGVRTGALEWSMAGTPGDPRIWNSALTTWIHPQDQPAQ